MHYVMYYIPGTVQDPHECVIVLTSDPMFCGVYQVYTTPTWERYPARDARCAHMY
jgi:hypothetical protein